jgi:hypothetical protein
VPPPTAGTAPSIAKNTLPATTSSPQPVQLPTVATDFSSLTLKELVKQSLYFAEKQRLSGPENFQ